MNLVKAIVMYIDWMNKFKWIKTLLLDFLIKLWMDKQQNIFNLKIHLNIKSILLNWLEKLSKKK